MAETRYDRLKNNTIVEPGDNVRHPEGRSTWQEPQPPDQPEGRSTWQEPQRTTQTAVPNANEQKQEQLSQRTKPVATTPVYPNQQQGYNVTSDKEGNTIKSQQAPGEVIPATLKAQSDWNAIGKYMYLPNHPKAVNGYVQLSKGDVIWARQKLNLPTDQPKETAPTTQTAPQITTTATQPKDAVDKQAVGVPLDQRGELLKQYQKAMRNAKKIKAQYISKAKQYFRAIEQIKADAEGNKEYRMNEAYMKWSDEKRSLNGEYQKAMQVASQYYEQLRK